MTRIFRSLTPKPARSQRPGPARIEPPKKPVPSQALEKAALEKAAREKAKALEAEPKEIGGPEGPEPTRYGDWERKGICYDF